MSNSRHAIDGKRQVSVHFQNGNLYYQLSRRRSFYGADDSNLRPVDEIPPPFNKVFAKYRNFNVLQSRVLDEVFYTGEFLGRRRLFFAIVVSAAILMMPRFFGELVNAVFVDKMA